MTVLLSNRQRTESYGIKVGIKVLPLNDLSISVSYTYTDGEEDDKDLSVISPLLRLEIVTLMTITHAALHLPSQAGLRQTQRLQDLGAIKK